MFNIISFASILLLILITIIISLRHPSISKVLAIALLVRFLFLLINNYMFYLPDAEMDAKSFESLSWQFSQDGLKNIYKNYSTAQGGTGAYFLSFLIAIPYSLFGRNILLAQSISIFFGMACVYLGWLVGKKLWNERIAIKVAWTIALFPSLVSYSVLTMREVYISFFLLLGIYGIVRWIKFRDLMSMLIVFFGFITSTLFHGATAIGLFAFLFIVFFDSLKKTLKLLLNNKINLNVLVFLIFSFFILYLFFNSKISIPYIQTFDNNINFDFLREVINLKVKGDAAYPDWTKINSEIELVYKTPLRSLYFLFSPFPWEINKLSHMIGLLDGLLYITLAYLIFLNRKVIWNDPATRIVLIILILYFIVFGLGTGNFGTSIRHRSKFVIEMILLAAPLIPKLNFSKKKDIKM